MEESQHDWAGLLERTRRRDAEAAESLVEALYPIVRVVVCRRSPSTADVRDLIQESLLRALQGIKSFRGEGPSLPAWARRIAFRVCLNEWRRRKSRPERLWSDLTDDQAAVLSGVPDSATDAEREARAARELVGLLLDRLSPEERWVIELADLEQRSLEDITSLTGWSPLNIRVRRFRARRKLKQVLTRLQSSKRHEH